MPNSHVTDSQPNWGVKLPDLHEATSAREENARPYRRMGSFTKAACLVASFAIIVATGYAYYLVMNDTYGFLVIPVGLVIGFAFAAWLYRRYDDLQEL